ncbi:hypothetical protein [Knoellia sp. p5-6-4]|uniref:hypothetical protein n=1 Tax=unclassified Knoellia TaxID=2618719 RepID=UPI0023D9C4F4|nr:hypothetical protein [Knoellia sp. p5-6-4]MDF2144533.1 hypothetical protein [Knoellia sp. p5-6-4]
MVGPSDEGVAEAIGVELMEYRESQGAGVTGRPVSHLADWRGRPPREMGHDDEVFYGRLHGGDYDDRYDAEYDDSCDEYGRRVGTSTLGRMTVLVMMDDQVVDVMQRSVQGSGYECAALELGRGRPEPVEVAPPPPEPPRHERELGWLARLVGSHEALDELSVDPLPGDEPLELSPVPDRCRERVQVISEQVDDVAARLFDDEVRTACRRLLVRAVAAEPGLLREPSRDEVVPAAVLWAVGKANDLLGPGRVMPVSAITALCGLKSTPTERGRAFAHAVAGPRGVRFGRHGYGANPDVLELGSADLLVSRFRRQLVGLRDLALAEQERLRAG